MTGTTKLKVTFFKDELQPAPPSLSVAFRERNVGEKPSFDAYLSVAVCWTIANLKTRKHSNGIICHSVGAMCWLSLLLIRLILSRPRGLILMLAHVTVEDTQSKELRKLAGNRGGLL